MRVLVVDIGGTNVKILASGEKIPRKFPSGEKLTPRKMVAGVKELAKDWKYDAVAIGYPGQVRDGRIMTEPKNLGRRWVGFDFKSAFGCPVQIMNDAAMQALGSYKRGLLLFLGLGTGLGAALGRRVLSFPWSWLTCHSRTRRMSTTSAPAPCGDWAGRNGRSMSSTRRRG
jgi:polyphosphate glucokinase